MTTDKDYRVNLQKLLDAGAGEWYWQIRDAKWDAPHLASSICPFRIAVQKAGPSKPLPQLEVVATATPRLVQNERKLVPVATATPSPRFVQNDRRIAPTATPTPAAGRSRMVQTSPGITTIEPPITTSNERSRTETRSKPAGPPQ